MKKILYFCCVMAAMLFTACSDDEDTVTPDDLLRFEILTYTVAENGDVEATAQFVTSLKEFTACGLVYNFDAGKAPSTTDNVVLGSSKEITVKVYKDMSDFKKIFRELNATLPQKLLQSEGTMYVRAFVTAHNGMTFYSNETLKIGDGDISAAKQLALYEAPEYVDNYTTSDLTKWSYRYSWNLSNVHDPSVMLADDGYYYMYQTDASYGNVHESHGHFLCRRSKDLVNWEFLGATMQKCPDWCLGKINEMRAEVGAEPLSDIPDYGSGAWGYWAPVVRNMGNGTYRMYYSIVVPGYLGAEGTSWGERGMIGMMETTDPSDVTSWEDKGYVISSPSDKNKSWNVNSGAYDQCYFLYNGIDPSYIVTPEGNHWLIYGSWHSGIVEVEINPETGKPLHELGSWFGNGASAVASYGNRIYSRVAAGNYWSRWQGSEGPEIIYNDKTGYYYLFLAYDELDIPYNTRVLRSKSITGPFLDITGADRTNNPGNAYPVVTHPYHWTYSANTWVGISHVAVFQDGKDNWFIASQARLADVNANMLGHIRRLLWTEDGWPIAVPERYGNVPQVPITADELRGTWDFIDITYEKGVAKEGVLFEMKASGTCAGNAFNGQSWSFDETTSTLTIGTQKFMVTRECDFDSNPRRATIVFCAYSSNGTHTYWGKRIY